MESWGAACDVIFHQRVALYALISILASGCASVVYKNSASTFSATGRANSMFIANSSKQLDTVKEAIQKAKISNDSFALIRQNAFLFARKKSAAVMNTKLQSFPNRVELGEYQKLQHCKQAAAGAACSVPMKCHTVCHSSDEDIFFSQLEGNYAIALYPSKLTQKSTDPALKKEATPFVKRLEVKIKSK